MTVIPEVEAALVRAVARYSRRRRWRPGRRAIPLAAVIVVLGGTAVAETGPWTPQLGSDDHRGHPTATHAPVPGDQRAELAVLRRPQLDADRSPHVQEILRLLVRREIAGVHVDDIRLLRETDARTTILLPARRVGSHDKGYPSSIQRRVLCVLVSFPPIQPPGGRRPTGRIGGAGQVCGSLKELEQGRIRMLYQSPSGWRAGGLVPDGVASVVIRLRQHRTVSATVHDNYYEADTGTEMPPGWPARWIDASGRTVKHASR